jgi:hypothetical protein
MGTAVRDPAVRRNFRFVKLLRKMDIWSLVAKDNHLSLLE